MKVDEFVRDALIGIIQGVTAAQEKTGIGLVNPTDIMYQADAAPKNCYYVRYGNPVSFVEFDIALSATDSDSIEGGGKLKIFSTEIGGKADTKSLSTNVSRMKFDVPIVFPQSGEFSSRDK